MQNVHQTGLLYIWPEKNWNDMLHHPIEEFEAAAKPE
jgi:hypothetical protein